MIYRYVGIDKNGKKIKGEIEAISIEEAKDKLNNIVLLKIYPSKKVSLYLSTVSTNDLVLFFNTLGLYLKASIPIIKALILTKSQLNNPKLIKFVDYLITSLKEGKSLYEAINNQKIVKFKDYVISSIKVAEESGKLDLILLQIANFLKKEDKLFSKLSQSLVYPMFIILVAIIMVNLIFIYVVPKIVKMYENMNTSLPKITQIIIDISSFLRNNYIIILVLIFLVSITIILIIKKSKKAKLFLNKVKLKIPFINRLIITQDLSKFSYLVHVLTSSGVNYIDSLILSANSINNEVLKNKILLAIKEVKKGKKFSVSLEEVEFNFDKSFIPSIALAEEIGDVKMIFSNLSEIYLQENETKLQILLSMIEPLLMIIIGAIIGLIVIALLLPIFSLNIIK